MLTEVVANSLRLNLALIEELIARVPEGRMCHQPPGVPNHPAWTLGHLAQSCQALGEEIGLSHWLPEDWAVRFGTGSQPGRAADTPPATELLAVFRDANARVLTRLAELSPEACAEPLPDVRYRATFPTVGHVLVHILVSHIALHLGQLTVWARAAGLDVPSEMDQRDTGPV